MPSGPTVSNNFSKTLDRYTLTRTLNFTATSCYNQEQIAKSAKTFDASFITKQRRMIAERRNNFK
jgi:hypothetical protein